MQVNFETRDEQARALRELVAQRLRFVLRRSAAVVSHATVRLADENGPRGGVDKQCQVVLQAEGGTRVVGVGKAADWRTALDQALQRVQRLLLRLRRKLVDPRPPRRQRALLPR